jgi:hypothetical protein
MARRPSRRRRSDVEDERILRDGARSSGTCAEREAAPSRSVPSKTKPKKAGWARGGPVRGSAAEEARRPAHRRRAVSPIGVVASGIASRRRHSRFDVKRRKPGCRVSDATTGLDHREQLALKRSRRTARSPRFSRPGAESTARRRFSGRRPRRRAPGGGVKGQRDTAAARPGPMTSSRCDGATRTARPSDRPRRSRGGNAEVGTGAYRRRIEKLCVVCPARPPTA